MAEALSERALFFWKWRVEGFRGLSCRRRTYPHSTNYLKHAMNKQYFIGLDVHKDSIAIAYALEHSREDATYHGSCSGSNSALKANLKKLAKKLEVSFDSLALCYEAGPTGFTIARHFSALGLDVTVMAPTKTTRKPGEKIKTDKRDAIKIAREFRNGDVVPVRVPPALDEAMRDVARARTDASDDLSRSRQRLKSFLLRNAIGYQGKANWSGSHMEYLRRLALQDPAQQIVLEEYILAIDNGINRVQRLTDKLKELLLDWEWKPIVEALMAFRGFQEVAAITIISELGDLRRFSNPRQLMSFLGLVPGEHSSGSKRRQGSITKCGNSHARWMLVECAQHYRRAPKVSRDLSKRQEKQKNAVKELGWRAQNRLHKRYNSLKARHLAENKALIAITRELSSFIWELMNKCQLPMPGDKPN